jgi:hypothetical protein
VSTSAADADCPFKGTAPFDTADAGWFFGRTRLVERLVSRLKDQSTLVVGGPAGCGKSSVVRAGVLPALAGGALPGSGEWRHSVFTPGAHPLDALWVALGELAGKPLPDIFSLEEAPGSMAVGVVQTGVLVVDQFEELFTASSDPAERGAFLSVLEALAGDGRPGFRLILCVDTAYYGSCAGNPWLASVVSDNHVLVGPMTPDEQKEAVEGPARRAGLRLEEGLAQRILDDAGGSLPLLSQALTETWRARKGRILTLEGYEAARGAGQAVMDTPATWEPPASGHSTARSTAGPRTPVVESRSPADPPPEPVPAVANAPGTLAVIVALVVLAVVASLALGILLTQVTH